MIFASGCINPLGQYVQTCGGFVGIKCPTGYECELNPNSTISDDTGRCVPIVQNTNVQNQSSK